MNDADLADLRSMIQERGNLLRFMQRKFGARYVGVYIPIVFDPTSYRGGEASHYVMLDDKVAVDAIIELALPAARARIAKIEERLTLAGVELRDTGEGR